MAVPQRALVIDDDRMMQAIGVATLKSRGVGDVATASTGSEALKLIDESRDGFELIISDLNMPDLDGLQLMRALSTRAFTGGVAIVSGEDRSILEAAGSIAEKSGLNVIGRLKKPINPQSIVGILSSWTPEKRTKTVELDAGITGEVVKRAIEERAIVPHFQPQLSVETGALVGAEALARWSHPQLGAISPEVFVPVAEENGLVSDLTDLILEQSLELLSTLPAGHQNFNMAINTDAKTVNQIGFPDAATALCRRFGIPNSNIVFEVTERSLLDENAASIEVLARLRMAQFGVSIDDFGTGHTNIRQLCVYPFTELKIDRSFLVGAAEDVRHMTCLHAMVSLGRALGMKTIAEGIETESDVALLRRLGVDYMQGYFLAKPMPGTNFASWISRQNI